MTKEDLRTLYKQKRMALSAEGCAERDRLIFEELVALDWSTCRYVHVYLPLHKFNEPDTLAFASWIRQHYPYVKLVISRSDFMSGTMLNYVWDEHTIIEENKWGIPEPMAGTQVDEKLIDTVLVPLLVADKQGNRVGYGKGFYDRFLAQCKPDVRTIGLSYFEPLNDTLNADSWDIPLQYCVCPSGFYTFT